MTKQDDDAPGAVDVAVRRRRVLFCSQHRGMKEMDVLLGGFAAEHLDSLDETQFDRFEALIEEGDNDIFDWVTGKAPPPADFDHGVLRMIQAYMNGKLTT